MMQNLLTKNAQKVIFHNFSFILFVLALTLIACQQNPKRKLDFPKTDLESSSLIPKPKRVIAYNSGFALDKFTTIHSSEFSEIGQFLAKKIKTKTSLDITVNDGYNNDIETIISIEQSSSLDLESPEAYELSINRDSILLTASTEAGAFRGIQTLRQLIPEFSNDTLAENSIWVIPTGIISDAPRYEYRSTMLDVSRHFFSVEDVKKYIDVLSYYKINVLHLHLSDDQGWRIQIKSWPRLTEVGGSTEVGGESGGFYTQEDYKEIVRYAAEHHIVIVPEIDMPGHTNAASVSYPFLNGNGKTPELYEGMKVGFSTFDTRKDTVYAFIDDVVREISALTPGPYFHIGGDESHSTKKDDYIHFINKVEKTVQRYGKRLIGWDEVANTDVDSTSIVQLWASPENAEIGTQKGMSVIVSYANKAYLDMKYDSLSKHGLTWAGYIPIDTAYNWDPKSFVDSGHILGIEAPLWSETISNISELEYLAFPRVIGYAEIGWTHQGQRNWQDYSKRLAAQAPFLKRMDVNYYPSPLIQWPSDR